MVRDGVPCMERSIMPWWIDDKVAARLEHLDVRFNQFGLDPYGISRDHLGAFFSALSWFYTDYFNVSVYGAEHIPDEGAALVIGNHSGGIPVDAGMLLSALFWEKEHPRLGHAMVEKFASKMPFLSSLYSRFGQFTGLPEHATRFLREGRLVVAFPEGVRGIGKLYSERYELERFGTGFVRIALAAKAPIVPFAFVGGEEAFPILFKLERLGQMVGAPFIPIPTHLVPLPKPVSCQIYFGEPLRFEGDGNESDEVILVYVNEVKRRVKELIEQGRTDRRDRLSSGFETEQGDV